MLESELERKICDFVKSLGGRAFKWVSPGEVGVPDRICIFPGAHVIFVELKRPGRKDGASVRQKKILGLLTKLGCTAWLINDFEDFKTRLRQEGIYESKL